MSKIRAFIIVLLTLAVIVLIGLTLSSEDNHEETVLIPRNDTPTYQSQHTESLGFTPAGKLEYKLIAEKVQYYENQKEGWFFAPKMILYNDDARPEWTIQADKAVIKKGNMLYLLNNVEIINKAPTFKLKKITTEQAQIDLTTQDISSDTAVTLTGIGFSSHGLKLRGNLNKKHAELLEKVTTTYDIEKK